MPSRDACTATPDRRWSVLRFLAVRHAPGTGLKAGDSIDIVFMPDEFVVWFIRADGTRERRADAQLWRFQKGVSAGALEKSWYTSDAGEHGVRVTDRGVLLFALRGGARGRPVAPSPRARQRLQLVEG